MLPQRVHAREHYWFEKMPYVNNYQTDRRRRAEPLIQEEEKERKGRGRNSTTKSQAHNKTSSIITWRKLKYATELFQVLHAEMKHSAKLIHIIVFK